MLDQLVESRNTAAENTRRSEFLLGTLAIAVTVLVGAWIYSLFNKAYDMGNLDIGEQVSRVALPEDEPPPPPPEPEKQPDQKATANPDKPTVIEKIATMEETREPPKDIKGETLKSPPLDKPKALSKTISYVRPSESSSVAAIASARPATIRTARATSTPRFTGPPTCPRPCTGASAARTP